VNLEEAIQTAIDYEIKVRDVYEEACEKIRDVSGKRIVQALMEDEQRHVAYLESKLEQCRKNGTITLESLKTVIPSKEVIDGEVEKLKDKISKAGATDKKQILSKALELEIETSDFYRKMVNEMSQEGKDLFAHFLEIENAHITLVQAECDYFNKTGYWFDIKEFDME